MLMTWIMQGSILMYRHVGGMGADLGKLALALQALLIAGAITGEMITASLPVLARSVDRSDGKPGFYLAAVLSGGVLLSGSLVILALTVGPGLITAFIGKDYSETAALLPWTLALSAPCFWASALSNLIVAHDRYRTVTVINGLGAAIFTAAFMLLTPVFHLPGVILALAIGLLCVVAAQFVVLRRFYDFAFAGTITRALLAVVPGALVACLLVPVNSWLALSAGLAATGLLACWLGVVDLARMAKLRTAIFSARGSSLGRPSGD
jgi:O-antigen/teichoic acid export membrane protein